VCGQNKETFFKRRNIMFYKKISCLILMMILASSSYAQNNWTNATGNGDWLDPNNWSIGVPGPGTGNTRINPDTNINPNNPIGPTIGPGQLATTDAMDVWGPEFGPISVNIIGGSYTSPAFVGMVSVNTDPNAAPSINMGANGSGGWLDVNNFLVGDSWWYSDGPYTTYNQWSGTAIIRDYLWIGGKVNLFGGTMYVFNGVSMASVGQSPEICTLNIEKGTLFLPLLAVADNPETPEDESVSFTTTVEGWIADGYCVAYGGKGEIVIEETAGWTKVQAFEGPTE
jgi:hypothetical protein